MQPLANASNSVNAASAGAAVRTHERTLQLLHRVVLPLERALQPADRQSGCTAAQLSALAAIRYLGKGSVSALAAHEGIALPTASRIVDGLVAAGLAERQPDPADRRALRLAVTEAGQAAIEVACDARAATLDRLLEGLTPEEWAGLRQAAETLNRVFGYLPPRSGT